MTVHRSTGPDAILAAALAYARRGYAVFPCKANKAPFTPNGYKDASTDPEAVAELWRRHPRARVGLATGDFFVVDPDGPDGRAALEELERQHGKLPKTATARTPRGGAHLYFRTPPGVEIRNSAGELAPGVDVRGRGGYVLAPPSEGYSWEHRAPIAEPPAWLIELLERRSRRSSGTPGGQGPRPGPVDAALDGPPIPQGTRDNALFKIACALRGRGLELAELLDHLTEINARRCSPPLPARDVERLAQSCCKRYPPGGGVPGGPGENSATVAEILEAAGDYWYAERLPGGGRSKLRDVYRTSLGFAARFGRAVTVEDEHGLERRAVRFSASCGQLASGYEDRAGRLILEGAGAGKGSVSRNIARLVELGAIRRVADGAKDSGRAQTLLIMEPRRSGTLTTSKVTTTPAGRESSTSARPPRPDTLSTPAPLWLGPIGNARAGSLYALEAFGPLRPAELAELLEMKRSRDLRRRHLEPLEELGLVAERADGRYELAADYAAKLAGVRQLPYETRQKRRVGRQSEEGRTVVLVEVCESAASTADREELARQRHRRASQAFRERHLRPVDEVPTEDRMREHRESFPERRRASIAEALAALFAERPEFKGRRVGQVTCALVRYLPEHFPRGQLGAPKDREVEELLAGSGPDNPWPEAV